MKDSKVLKTILIIAGLVGIIVGGANLFVPVEFNASSGINLGENINLLNEIKASGGGLLMVSVVIILGAFVSRLSFASTLLATLVYLGYGFSRLLSMVVDGMPSSEMVYISGFEIFMGFLALFALFTYSQKE